jgi:hypothetical protein
MDGLIAQRMACQLLDNQPIEREIKMANEKNESDKVCFRCGFSLGRVFATTVVEGALQNFHCGLLDPCMNEHNMEQARLASKRSRFLQPQPQLQLQAAQRR